MAGETRRESCDAVVVGSGAGGAVAAAELAEAGFEVVLLEEGRHFRTEDFSTDPREMIPSLYRDAGSAMIWGVPNIMFSEGCCVGGSTVINGGTCWRTPERILSAWSQAGLERTLPEDMASFFQRVEHRLHIGPQDPETVGRDGQLFAQGCEALGWPATPVRRNQLHCGGSNACILGCPTGAKQSTLVSYVPLAQRFGARLLPGVRVERVLFEGENAVGVEGRFVDDGGSGPTFLEVRAKLVVVAGGAAQTPALLLRSGLRHPLLGRNLLCHPNAKVIGVYDEEVAAYRGVIQAYQCHHFLEEGLLLATAFAPPGLVAMTFADLGPHTADVLREYTSMVFGGVLVEDTGSGRVRLTRDGQPRLEYTINSRDFASLVRGVSLAAQIQFAAGAKKVYLPFHGAPPLRSMDEAKALAERRADPRFTELLTVHIMGTARMGATAATGVVDAYGEVHGRRGLFVADASVFPGPVGVNPMETIMAFSTRFAHRIAERRAELVGPRAAA